MKKGKSFQFTAQFETAIYYINGFDSNRLSWAEEPRKTQKRSESMLTHGSTFSLFVRLETRHDTSLIKFHLNLITITKNKRKVELKSFISQLKWIQRRPDRQARLTDWLAGWLWPNVVQEEHESRKRQRWRERGGGSQSSITRGKCASDMNHMFYIILSVLWLFVLPASSYSPSLWTEGRSDDCLQKPNGFVSVNHSSDWLFATCLASENYPLLGFCKFAYRPLWATIRDFVFEHTLPLLWSDEEKNDNGCRENRNWVDTVPRTLCLLTCGCRCHFPNIS